MLSELATILPAAVKKFMNTANFDTFVLTCILHFVAIFEKEYLQRAYERVQKNLADVAGVDPIAVEAKLQELDAAAARHCATLSPLYCMVR